MEITLQKENISLYETVWRKTAETVAETDAIVPDTKPDIGRILKTECRGKITGQDMIGDKLSLRGEAVFYVLYMPEGGDGIPGAMEIRVPFKDVCTPGGEGTEIFADAEIGQTECMVLNSRKISVKAHIHMQMEGIRREESALSTGAEADLPLAVKTKPIRFSAPTGRGTFTVRCADTLDVPRENPPIDEILHTEAYLLEEDIKLITGKMIVKGNVRLKTLYTSPVPGYPLSVMEHEIPFTEILDMPGTEEGMDGMLDYEIREIYCETDDDPEGARTFGAEVTVEIRAKTFLEKELEILDDCFCPGYVTEIKRKNVMTEETADTVSEQISVKKTVTLPSDYPSISEVCALYTKPETGAVSVRDGKVTIEGYVEAQLLYKSEEDGLCSYTEKIPYAFSAPTRAGEEAEIAVRTRPGGGTYTLTDGETVEVRAIVAFDVRLSTRGQVQTVSEIILAEAEEEKRPSVVIVFTGEKDTLWGLAKKYGVTTEKIMAANGLSDGAEVRGGMRLLVPKG